MNSLFTESWPARLCLIHRSAAQNPSAWSGTTLTYSQHRSPRESRCEQLQKLKNPAEAGLSRCKIRNQAAATLGSAARVGEAGAAAGFIFALVLIFRRFR
jgi:hypothetical protein